MSCNTPFFKLDKYSRVVQIPCGRCWACREDYIRQWTDRFSFESQGKSTVFVTLTYDDGHLQTDELRKRDLQNYFKRLRFYGLDFKYLACGEYGKPDGGFRPHFHIVFSGVPFSKKDLLEKCWSNGFVLVKPCDIGAVRYVLKYIVKQKDESNAEVFARCDLEGFEYPFFVCSKGIGKTYMLHNYDTLKKYKGYYKDGKLRPLPRYYRNGLGLTSKLNLNLKNEYKIREEMKKTNENFLTTLYRLGEVNEKHLEKLNLTQNRGSQI